MRVKGKPEQCVIDLIIKNKRKLTLFLKMKTLLLF